MSQFLPKSFKLLEYYELPSTMDKAKALFPLIEQYLCVSAATQTRGRGQYAKSWHSKAGEGLYLSYVNSYDPDNLHAKIESSRAELDGHLHPAYKADYQEKITSSYLARELLTFYVSSVVLKTIKEALKSSTDQKTFENTLSSELTIKPLNDIYFKNKKLAGILIENYGEVLNIGIGVNFKLSQASKTAIVEHQATSLSEIQPGFTLEQAQDLKFKLARALVDDVFQ